MRPATCTGQRLGIRRLRRAAGLGRRGSTNLGCHCLQPEVPAVSTTKAIESYLTHEPGAQDMGTGTKPGVYAGTAVAAAVVLAVAVAGVLLCCRRRQQGATQQLLPTMQQSVTQPPVSSPEHQAFCDTTCPQARWPQANNGMAAQVFAGHSGADTLGEAELGNGPCGAVGWRVMASHTASEIEHLNLQDKISLGVLLGAGSVSRVYKGCWLGLEVAVKVWHHDSTSAAAMATDMGLIMKLRHQNITKILHFATWKYSDSSEVSSQLTPLTTAQGRPQVGGIAVCKPAREAASRTTGSCSSSVSAQLLMSAQSSATKSDNPHRQEQLQHQGGGSNHGQHQQQRSAGGSSSSKQDSQWQAAGCQTWLVLEFCDGGTLPNIMESRLLIRKTTGKVNLAHVLTLLCDISSGMAYLHSRNVLHGNLTPGNVLMKKKPGAAYGHQAKVTDFASSRSHTAGKRGQSLHTNGAVNHASPELLRLGRVSPASDMYAFAIIMWELYTGRVAWSQLHYGEIFKRVAFLQERPSIPTAMPTGYATLMVACWSPDPFQRPTFQTTLCQLQCMLSGVVQEEQDAQDRFFSDL